MLQWWCKKVGRQATALSLRAIPDNGRGGEVERTDDFKPAGELVIVPDAIENRDYRRALDLDTATAEVRYDGVTYEYTADSVHDRLFAHIKGALSARVDLVFRQDMKKTQAFPPMNACGA